MNTLVLDASVAVKWAIPSAREPFTDESLRLLRLYVNSELDFIVPDVFWAEIGNLSISCRKPSAWQLIMAEPFTIPSTSPWPCNPRLNSSPPMSDSPTLSRPAFR